MIHRKPQWIESMLERESRGELLTLEQQERDYKPEAFEYYVPYLYMRPDASNELRSIFHSFVFIKASERRIQELVKSDWNTRTRYSLFHYRNRAGKVITISDREYEQLKDIIYNTQLRVFFGIPTASVRNMKVGSKVLLQIKNWENHPGVIDRIHLKKDGVRVRVAFNLLGQTKRVIFDDLHDGDITFADNETEQLITGDLVRNFEHEVSILLEHRFKKQGEMVNGKWLNGKSDDFTRLRRLLVYSDIQIDDEEDRKRFLSLMLICATLLPDKEASKEMREQLEECLMFNPRIPVFNPQSFTEAYMMLALFINTRDPRMRDAVKAYRKQHPDCPQILGTFLNKVRNIKTNKTA